MGSPGEIGQTGERGLKGARGTRGPAVSVLSPLMHPSKTSDAEIENWLCKSQTREHPNHRDKVFNRRAKQYSLKNERNGCTEFINKGKLGNIV